MSEIDRAVKHLAQTASHVNLITATSGSTADLGSEVEQLAEACANVLENLDGDDVPDQYTGWADHASGHIPDTVPEEWQGP